MKYMDTNIVLLLFSSSSLPNHGSKRINVTEGYLCIGSQKAAQFPEQSGLAAKLGPVHASLEGAEAQNLAKSLTTHHGWARGSPSD